MNDAEKILAWCKSAEPHMTFDDGEAATRALRIAVKELSEIAGMEESVERRTACDALATILRELEGRS